VSRSGFYAWHGRLASARTVRDAQLTVVISEVHQRSRRTYGAPRVHAELRRLNQRCSRKRVARLMRDAGLVGACSPALAARPPGHRTGTGPGQSAVRPAGPGSGVGRGRDPVPHRPGLALPRRGHRSLQPPCRGLGHERSTGHRPGHRRADDGLPAAAARPAGRAPQRPRGGGGVYTSLAFSHRLAERGLAQSFGSTGDAYDNAAVEAFWSTLKRELAWIHQRTTWSTRTELRTAVFDYIEAFYNPERIQRRLGHHSPAAYEKTTAVARDMPGALPATARSPHADLTRSSPRAPSPPIPPRVSAPTSPTSPSRPTPRSQSRRWIARSGDRALTDEGTRLPSPPSHVWPRSPASRAPRDNDRLPI
jgi:putative transposase